MERSLAVTARGDRQIDLLEQLVLLTLAMKETNCWCNPNEIITQS